MKKPAAHKKQIKLIEEDNQPVQLRIAEEVEVLTTDQKELSKIKTQDPCVSAIITDDDEAEDLEEAWGEKKRNLPSGWLILTALVILGLSSWAMYSVFKAQPTTQQKDNEKKDLLVDLNKENEEVKLTLLNMEDRVRGYLSAPDLETMLQYVRHPDRVKPLMEHYYQSHDITPGEFEQFKRIRSMGLESLSFVYGRVSLTDGTARKVLIEQLSDGSFKVDWESDVCYLPMVWSDYIKQTPAEPMDMRVHVTPDHFYAFEFRDESKYQCYKITTRDSDEHLFGYVKKGSRAAIDIKQLIEKRKFNGGGTKEPMTLRLVFPSDSHSKRCVIIDSMLAPRWTYVTAPPKAITSK